MIVMPCNSVIYSGPLDGAHFVTPSPWVSCFVHVTVNPDDPFECRWHVSASYQPGYHRVWLHGVLVPDDTSPRIYVYKPFRPYEPSTPPN